MCELGGEIMEWFINHTRKGFTWVVVRVVGPRRYSMRFEGGFEKDLISNQLNIMKHDRSYSTEEVEEVNLTVVF